MSEIEKFQASAELGQFIGQGLVGFGQAIRYGYRPTTPSDQDIKDAIDAINNYVKVFSNNEQEVKQCDFLVNMIKAYIDYTGKQRKW